MRDAFGGAFMVRIMLVFIFLFVFFIAIALNFASAFRIKNNIVNYLEENQVLVFDNSYANQNKIASDFARILDPFNYGFTCDMFPSDDATHKCIHGVEITMGEYVEKNGIKYYYYNVEVLVNRDLGFMKALLTLTRDSDNSNMSGTWTIRGKTKVILN